MNQSGGLEVPYGKVWLTTERTTLNSTERFWVDKSLLGCLSPRRH